MEKETLAKDKRIVSDGLQQDLIIQNLPRRVFESTHESSEMTAPIAKLLVLEESEHRTWSFLCMFTDHVSIVTLVHFYSFA